MKKLLFVLSIFAFAALLMSNSGCDSETVKPKADQQLQAETEKMMQEANAQTGMPAIINWQEKKLMKQIYELRDKEDFICYAYLFNEYEGKIGQYLGKCIGYGLPYSTQYSNPMQYEDVYHVNGGSYGKVMPQPEPNGLFMPEGLSATWLLLLDDKGEPHPIYVEPSIIVSPFPLHSLK